MISALALLVLSQTVTPVRQAQSRDGGVAWPVEVTSMPPISLDVGDLSVNIGAIDQGKSADGGTDWPVSSKQGLSRDGGVDWPVTAKLTAADGTAIGTSGAPLRVDPTGTTPQPVTGTFWQATQPVSGPLTDAQLRATAVPVDGSGVTQPVSGTFWQATQPVSAAALPLPSGAATAAKQPALGTAGTPSADVLTVQGRSSMTPLLVDGSGATQPVSASSLPLPTGAATAAAQTDKSQFTKLTDGTDTALVSGSGSLQVTCDNCGGSTFADDSAFTFTSQTVVPFAYVYDDDSPNSVTEDNAATPRMSANRVPYAMLRDAAGNERGANVTAANALKVDGSAVTQPVSGTVAATQSGTWNVNNVSGTVSLPTGAATSAKQPALGTAGSASSDVITVQGVSSMTPLLVDGSGTTQPISGTVAATQSGNWDVRNVTGTVSLPTGAATAAKQPAFGTAGTASADVVTVQGKSGMTAVVVDGSGVTQPVSGPLTDTELRATAVPVDGSGVTQPVSGTVTVTDGSGALTVDGTVTANQGGAPWSQNITQVAGASVATGHGTASGALRVELPTDGTGVVGLAAGSAQIGHLEANQSTNVAQINGVTPLMGNGASGTGAQRVTIANDSTGIIALTTGSAQIGHLEANQSVNLAQVAGSSTATGNGTAAGALRVSLASDSTGQVALAAGSATVGSVKLTDGTTQANVIAGTAALKTDTSSIAGTATSVGNGTSGNGVQRVTLASDSTGQVTLASGTTTAVTQATASNLNAQVVGSIAHDTGVGGNPVQIAGYAETAEDSDANTNGNRTSTDGDVTRLVVDRNGAVYTRMGPPHQWSYHENSSSALTDTTVHASCGTGLYNYITSITVSTGAATALNAFIEDSTTTTILGPYYLEAVAGRGFSVQYPGGKKQTNSATLVSITTSAAIAHSIDITGFCAP